MEYIIRGKTVSDYIKRITPNKEDVPNYYLKVINKYDFEIVVITKDVLVKDTSLMEYINAGENRYDITSESVYQPIVIVNGEILDGYNRCLTLFEEKIICFVNLKKEIKNESSN